MALPVRDQLTYWGIALAVFLLCLWYLGNVLLPFVLGAGIAYLLDPLADRLEAIGFSRVLATITITAGAIVVFIISALLIIPTLIEQVVGLVRAAPAAFQNLESFLTRQFPSLLEEESVLRRSLASLAEMVQSSVGIVANEVLAGALSLLNIVVLVVLVPVVTFYLLLDWDRIVAAVDDLLPRDHTPTIRRLASEIDATMAGFLRGQGTVCLILGVFYATSLMLIGLDFGLVVGLIAGALTFIPYVGALVGGALSIGIALFQFWGDWIWIIAVAAVFQFGQLIEGNVLTPKLVGSSVGLHPVWLLFALSVFGALFGFVGMLVAVPVSASLGVLVRFAVEQYKQGRLYRGLESLGDDE